MLCIVCPKITNHFYKRSIASHGSPVAHTLTLLDKRSVSLLITCFSSNYTTLVEIQNLTLGIRMSTHSDCCQPSNSTLLRRENHSERSLYESHQHITVALHWKFHTQQEWHWFWSIVVRFLLQPSHQKKNCWHCTFLQSADILHLHVIV